MRAYLEIFNVSKSFGSYTVLKDIMSAKFQCPYCGVGCGLLMGGGRVRGDKDHPANFGDVCKKPLYYPKVMNKGRLLKPMYREDKKEPFVEIDWGTAYEILRQKLTEIEREGLYFYVSGRMSTF